MNKTLFAILIVMILAVIAGAYDKYFYTKNYDFFVEAPCDPLKNVCFIRDCDDGCPPNGLEEYRVFTLSASDFNFCKDNSCLDECTSGSITCEETMCGDSEEDECTGETN
jgi:hypothetical protein